MGIHFENSHCVHPGKAPTLFHHSTSTFMKVLFANEHVKPWETEIEQRRQAPCPHRSLLRREEDNQIKQQRLITYSVPHTGKARVSPGHLAGASVSVRSARSLSFLRCIECCFFLNTQITTLGTEMIQRWSLLYKKRNLVINKRETQGNSIITEILKRTNKK